MAAEEHSNELLLRQVDKLRLRSERHGVIDAKVGVSYRWLTHEPARIGRCEPRGGELIRQVLAQHRLEARAQHIAPRDPLDRESLGSAEVVLDLVQPRADPHAPVLVAHAQHPHELFGEKSVKRRSALNGPL